MDDNSNSYPVLDYSAAPDYLKSADLHNIGSGNESMFSADYAVSVPGRIAKFGISSIASGINSIYNSGVQVANWFGADAEQNDVGVTLSGLDSDLGEYYQQNKEAIDVTGFIATSFIPGIGGVKLFNAGQKVLKTAQSTGFVGSTLSKAIGLVPTLEQDVIKAGAELAKGQAQFTLLNANVLQTVGSGFKQAAWESLAFESAVTATMFKSPLLEGQDYKDIGANILTGTLLGGAIGGVINSAVSYGKIKDVIKTADIAQKPYTLRSSTAFLQDPADRIVVHANDLSLTPAIDKAVGEGQEALRTQRTTNIYNDIRTDIHALSDDKELGNLVADTIQSMEPDQIANVMNGATRIVRPGKNIAAKDGEVLGWVNLFGDDRGKISWEQPAIQTIADRFKSVEEIDKYVKSLKFDTKKDWNIYTASGPEEIQGRYMWAKTANVVEDQVINSTDIPLLERALEQNIPKIRVDDGFTTYTVDRANLYNEVLQAKREAAGELGKAKRAAWVQDIISKDGRPFTTDDVARAVNVSRDFLENSEDAAAFMRQKTQADYDTWRKSLGLKGEADVDYAPSSFAVGYKADARNAAFANGGVPNNYLQSALITIKYQQKGCTRGC
jgi:hypothetical protein